jgi:hypothetical protein
MIAMRLTIALPVMIFKTPVAMTVSSAVAIATIQIGFKTVA